MNTNVERCSKTFSEVQKKDDVNDVNRDSSILFLKQMFGIELILSSSLEK